MFKFVNNILIWMNVTINLSPEDYKRYHNIVSILWLNVNYFIHIYWIFIQLNYLAWLVNLQNLWYTYDKLTFLTYCCATLISLFMIFWLLFLVKCAMNDIHFYEYLLGLPMHGMSMYRTKIQEELQLK